MSNNSFNELLDDIRLALRFRGLSQSGLHILAPLGFGRSVRTFQRKLVKMERRCSRELDKYQPTILWVDNFSNTLAYQVPKGDSTFRLALWTVFAGVGHPISTIHPIYSTGKLRELKSTFLDYTSSFMRKD
eukprot:1386031-Amorphochlora_amoeboformis.AAC.2